MSALVVVTAVPGAKYGTILEMRLPFFTKLDEVAMMDLPPSDHCAPLTKSACPPVPDCCLHPMQSAAASPKRLKDMVELMDIMWRFFAIFLGSFTKVKGAA